MSGIGGLENGGGDKQLQGDHCITALGWTRFAQPILLQPEKIRGSNRIVARAQIIWMPAALSPCLPLLLFRNRSAELQSCGRANSAVVPRAERNDMK